MKIKRISIENFRSIKQANILVSDFNIFVGQNNCGKTNLFEALEFFFNGYKGNIRELIFKRSSDLEMSVEIEFSDIQDGLSKMQNEKNRATLSGKLGNADIACLRRSSKDAKKRKLYIDGNEVAPGTGFDAALNDFLPKFEYITTKQYYDSVAKYSKTTPIGAMLSNVLATILQTNQQYREFQEKFSALFESDDSEIKTEFDRIGNNVKVYLEKQFPDTSKVRFEVTQPAFEDLLKNFNTDIDDGIETSAEEKGDGMQRALMLSIIQAYSDFRKQNEDAGKSFLFLIDEAELHLHPKAQRQLKEVLYDLSKDTDQVFINTHSSVFVADNYEGQSIFKVEKSSGETCISNVNESEKPYIIYDLLGGSPADLLLPNNFLIVEGQSEFELFTRIIKRFYSDKPSIQIIQAHGDVDQAEKSINAIEKLFTPLNNNIYGNKLVILMDCPSDQTKGGVDDFRKRYKHLDKNTQIFILDKRDIEQCYPNREDEVYGNWQKTQEQVDAMNGKKKQKLAIKVGDTITKDEFENSMTTCYRALERCWELSFKKL
ncbi:ATP-dependent nuclease [Bacteroides gallinarum]|uniref:ATP-dependent nuclease n=1 Tax=Bacteroides gallinarum TaxID=376806 RepID=UPI000368FF0B|nr:AAA family ATPase [Bacteroides gallinarum]